MYYLITLAPLYLIVMPAAAAVIPRIPKATASARNLTSGQFWIIALICLALMYAGNLVGTVVTALISLLAGKGMTNIMAELIGQSDIWAAVVVTAIIAPVAEELFFRKLLIDRLRGYGDRAAMVISAAAFGLFHGNFSQAFYAFGLGLAFGYIYLKTKRIGYTAALHMMINIVGGVLALLVQKAGQIALSGYSMLLLAAVITGTVLFFRHRHRIGFADEAEIEQPLQWKKPALLNVGMILFFVACAALFVWNTVYALS
jgi:membrane protease YdiL (CAAX protease family)